VLFRSHTDLTDYEADGRTLSRETTQSEQTWSLAEKIDTATVGAWFKKPDLGGPSAAFAAATADKGKGLGGQALVFTLLMLFFNAPIALAGGIENWIVVLLALGLLWWPVISSKESEA
jgi:hypothetical protein